MLFKFHPHNTVHTLECTQVIFTKTRQWSSFRLLPYQLQTQLTMAKVLDSHFLAITAIVTVYPPPLFLSPCVFLSLNVFEFLFSGFYLYFFLQVFYQFSFFVVTALLKFDKVTDFAGNLFFSLFLKNFICQISIVGWFFFVPFKNINEILFGLGCFWHGWNWFMNSKLITLILYVYGNYIINANVHFAVTVICFFIIIIIIIMVFLSYNLLMHWLVGQL